VPRVAVKDGPQVAVPEDQHAVGAFGSGGEQEPLRVSVHLRGLRGRFLDLDALAGEHGVESVGELRVAVPDEVTETAEESGNAHSMPPTRPRRWS
jgi:hypothetical protein